MSRSNERQPFLLGNLTRKPESLNDTAFAELISNLFTQLVKLHNEYLYAETGSSLMSQRIEGNLRQLSSEDYESLVALFCHPRFLIILALLQARLEQPTTQLMKFVKSITSNLSVTPEEETNLQDNFLSVHSQIWSSVGLEETSILDMLIRIEIGKNPLHSNLNLKKLKGAKQAASHTTGILFLEQLEQSKIKKPPDDVAFASTFIRDFLVSITSNIDLKVSKTFLCMIQGLDELARQPSNKSTPTFSYPAYLYDILFENSKTRGLLRTVLIKPSESQEWLKNFFHTFIRTLNTLTKQPDQLIQSLDSSFHTDKTKLDKAVQKFSSKGLLVLASIRSTLIEIVICHGYTFAYQNDNLWAAALTDIFIKSFTALRTAPDRKLNSNDNSEYRSDFLRPLSDEDYNSLAQPPTAAKSFFNQFLDAEGNLRKEPEPETAHLTPAVPPTTKPKHNPPTSKDSGDLLDSFFSLFPCYKSEKQKKDSQVKHPTTSIRTISIFQKNKSIREPKPFVFVPSHEEKTTHNSNK